MASYLREKKRKEWNFIHIAVIGFISLTVMLMYPNITRAIFFYILIGTFFLLIANLLLNLSLFKIRFGIRPINPNMVDVDYMDSVEFIHFLKLLFEAKGFYTEVAQGSNDYGTNIILALKDKKTVVQASFFSSNIGISAIQQAVETIPFYKAHNAVVVTNQYYTKQAKKLAKVNRIRLIDRDELIDMITEYKGGTRSIFNRLFAPFRIRLDRN